MSSKPVTMSFGKASTATPSSSKSIPGTGSAYSTPLVLESHDESSFRTPVSTIGLLSERRGRAQATRTPTTSRPPQQAIPKVGRLTEQMVSCAKVSLLAGKGSQKVAPMIASRKVVNNITKWNQVKEDSSIKEDVASVRDL